ncbi:thiamine-phosphate kinase, partial [Bacteroidales bacterium OttesenSCG-928-C19]|nr:thiamine-phosphate kinase [Bacteroidales bacterium OttesenSCG-928-C19]
MQENNNQKLTDLKELGEFGLIEHLTKNTKIHNNSTIVGIGDDAAVIGQYEKDILVSTDLLMEGVHFDMQYTPLKHLGYKAVAVNLSDIAAMNGRPTQILVSLAVSSRYSVEALEELYEGIHLACQRYHVDLVGGDTTSSKTGLAISITAIGEANKSDITYRNGAKKHDLLCVSGDLGAAYTGLLILEREKVTFQANPNYQPDLSNFSYVLERFLKPEPRLDIVSLLKEKEIVPTSMIDISDGLASEILHICKDSNVGCEVYEEKIPISHQTSIA